MGASAGYSSAGPSSCTLRIRGLPYECKAPEVADVLAEYGVLESDVNLTTNKGGKPSGECYVRFSTPQQAQMAFEEKQGQLIGSRYMELFMATELDWNQSVPQQFLW